MKIGIIGAGDVSKTLAVGLSKNHEVMISSRNIEKSKEFMLSNPLLKISSYKDAALFGDYVINALPGHACIEVLSNIKAELNHKTLIDLANPLEFSKDSFELFVANSDSLGEQIQRILPDTFVVKTLNTVTAKLMVNPKLLNQPHDIFICSNHEDAKQKVVDLLKNEFGWKIIHDLGNIQGSRAMEQLMHLWLKLWANIDNTLFNFHIETK